MAVTRRLFFIVLFLLITSMYALDQSTPYILTDFPIALVQQDTAIWIKWTGASRDPSNVNLVPDSGRIYYSRSPGGSNIDNYTDSITKRVVDTTISEQDTSITPQNNILFPPDPDVPAPRRGIQFKPIDNNMGAGVYYVMVGWRTKIGPLDTTFFSNEIQLIVEADTAVTALSPARGDTIEELTPVFQWEINPGVPYYHIIVSDEKIVPDLEAGTVEGLSIIWEAITANTQITYGAPDPSGTITADPPPLSPGKQYSWAILNNYGNHPMYTSTRFSMPWTFNIKGEPMKAPVNVSPADSSSLTISTDPNITFKWTNLDSAANTYKIYIYVTSDFEGIEAQMVVWSNEVTAGDFTGDTASAVFNAASILTSNSYTWKVMAIDNKGAGTSGNITRFKYTAPVGKLQVYTKEKIAVGNSTVDKAVGLAEIKVEVLDGSLEAPLLFYTDNDGYLSRDRPAGTYRLTAQKDGFESQTKTVTLTDGATATETFFLKRPDATVYGKVVDGDGMALNLATVVGVSDRGDTITAETDPNGNFVLSCYGADWSTYAEKTGYISSLSQDVTLTFGQNLQMEESITLKKNPYTLSGKVKNNKDESLLGVNIKLLREGVKIGEVPSTPQDGSYSFSIESGTYTITATKVGFVSYSATFDFVSSTQKNITMNAGAALIKGSIIGRSWNANFNQIFAPITNATVLVVDTATTPFDTFSTQSDNVYGDFSISVDGEKTFRIYSSANGFRENTSYVLVTTGPGKTHNILDTLFALATIKGSVRIGASQSADVENVSINFIDTISNQIIASARSDANGSFELRNVPNGLNYKVQAGGDGLIVDSVLLVNSNGASIYEDRIIVSDGLARVNSNNDIVKSITVDMDYGTKALGWVLQHGTTSVTNASIKIKSPLLKTVSPSDVISGVGIGSYIMTVDAQDDSLIDCSYHLYTIPAGIDSLHIDTLALPAVHQSKDTLALSSGMAVLTVAVTAASLDTGYLYFKDINSQVYDSSGYISANTSGNVTTYTFSVKPTKDGSYMMYYFKLIIGSDIYGYEQETFRSYIKPDPSIITRIIISPAPDDTLLLPANGRVDFTFNGYYGSKFLPATGIAAANITWSLVNPAGCALDNITKNVTVKTPASGNNIANTVALQALFVNDANFQLATNVTNPITVYFQVSSFTLDSIRVVRVDADEREYITTSPSDKAEFFAEGIDAGNNAVAISPTWSMYPDSVGTISDGVFSSSDDFVGYVRIYAKVGDITGEYNRLTDRSVNKSGLKVHYLVPLSLDTIETGLGCQIIIPDNLVDSGVAAEISMERPVLTDNKVKVVSGDFDVVSDAYDIREVKNVVFNYEEQDSTDSISIIIDVPEEYHDDAKGSIGKFYIALWNSDEIHWEPLLNSVVADDGKSLRVNTIHFSQYALMHKATATEVEFTIKPNPFSPYVTPRADYPELGVNVPWGTCFSIRPSSRYKNQLNFDLSIYNAVGDRVWSIKFQNATPEKKYQIWWDGKTTERPVTINLVNNSSIISNISTTGKMCRNGRYFVVLTLDDTKEEKQYLKQVILFK